MTNNKESGDEPSSNSIIVLSSASAGILNRLTTHPLDTVKARIQSSNEVGTNILDTFQQTFREGGLRSFYRGIGAVLIGGIPGTVLYLTGYEMFKHKLSSLSSKYGETAEKQRKEQGRSVGETVRRYAIHLTSGFLAEAVACIIFVPVDVVKERMQVSRIGEGRSRVGIGQTGYNPYGGTSFAAFKHVVKVDGLRKGVYPGYGATLASFGSFYALYFLLYEDLKERAAKYTTKPEHDLPLGFYVACSASSGAISSFVTSPLDMAKLRLQIQRGKSMGGGRQYRNMFDCLRRIYIEEGGLRGSFRGASARVFYTVPSTVITMTAYEKFKTYYKTILT